MFAPEPGPRVFGLPPGVDFAAELAAGLRQRLEDQPPEALARVEILVPTARVGSALTLALSRGQAASYLPRLRTLADLAGAAEDDLPPLERLLELTRLTRQLLAADPALGPPHAAIGLARSLAALADEMAEEGVPAAALAALDLGDHAARWQRTLEFLNIAAPWIDGSDGPGQRLRRAVAAQITAWTAAPPAHPVLIAGSTGSRGATAALMVAVAGLPQGAVILPGYDFDLPEPAWAQLDAPGTDDHPQARHRRVLRRLGLPPVLPWTRAPAPDPARNRLISLALRPAPVTDQWREDGTALPGAAAALDGVTLVEAPGPRAEALAIARAMAEARAAGRRVALVTPDRDLARRVSAALDRWRIRPDDSAGRPLGQTAPGRLLRLVAARVAGARDLVGLVGLLKHPLVHTGADRGLHLRHLRALELWLRRRGIPFPGAQDLADFARADADRAGWAGWLGGWLAGLPAAETPLAPGLAEFRRAVEALAAGTGSSGSGALWNEAAGAAAAAALAALAQAAPQAGDLTLAELPRLLELALAGALREDATVDPDAMIWGTQEVRARSADLVILGGLTEGVWPPAPGADPWLNRALRAEAGLRLPERRIGLSAHDFQIAAGAAQVILSWAQRTAEAEAVPSRWLIRLTNLCAGLPATAPGLAAARGRGQALIARALAAEADVSAVPPGCAARNPRPAPAPPVALRPTELRVTELAELIRNPYAVYARRVLGLEPLDPLAPEPDARRRGTLIHAILQDFVAAHPPGQRVPESALLDLARARLAAELPWPAERAVWLARLARIAPDFLAWHAACTGRPVLLEQPGTLTLPGLTLTGRPDRIDRQDDGRLALWDYKTGRLPTAAQQRRFDKQLILLALMAERGGFPGLAPAAVAQAAYVGLGSTFKLEPAPVEPETLADTRAGLIRLMASYRRREVGYIARRALQKDTDRSAYDALSRLGEWSVSDPAVTLPVGEADD